MYRFRNPYKAKLTFIPDKRNFEINSFHIYKFNNMKKLVIIAIVFFAIAPFVNGQVKGDIPVAMLPKQVKQVLNEYFTILTTAKDLDDCAAKFEKIAGAGLVNEDGTLRSSVQPYSLKKDFQNVNFYTNPPKIARVNKSTTGQSGFGATALAGTKYKIYVKKKNGGQPAPIHIIVPKNHPTIKTPKVSNIGSL